MNTSILIVIIVALVSNCIDQRLMRIMNLKNDQSVPTSGNGVGDRVDNLCSYNNGVLENGILGS